MSLLEPDYALRAEGIGKSFWRTTVLKSASLWAEPGRVTTLLGRNGSGKTTLLKIAAGWLRPDFGHISLLGTTKGRWTLAEMADSGLMYVPQDQLLSAPYRVSDHTSAIGKKFGSDQVEEAIEEFELESLMRLRVRTLSGGERMRVSLALALARAPEVLLIDEPLARLAPKNQEQLGNVLRRMAKRGTAVVTSGHDARALLDLSDCIVWCVAGTTHHLGSPGDALSHAQFRREYLGAGFSA